MTVEETHVPNPALGEAGPATADERPARSFLAACGRFLGRQYLAGVVVLVTLGLSIFHPSIISPGNLSSVLFQASLTGICAAGMALLISAGQLDLSVPGVIALSALTAAALLPRTTVGVAIVAALLVGCLLGAVNGLLVAYVDIPPFIATLGTQYLYLGIAFVLTQGGVAPISSYYYSTYTNAAVGMFPVVFLVLVVIAAVAYLLLYWTHFGRGMRSVGSNERAARLAGLAVGRIKVGVFALGGALFATSGVFLSGLLSSASGTMATGFELNAIAAVVVGGTSLRGGQATLAGAVVGAVVFSLLSNALNLLGVASYWQYVLTGLVLAVAVALGSLRRSQREVRGAE